MTNKVIYKNKWLNITKQNNYYFVDENQDQVVVIPIFDNNKFILVKQFRSPLSKFTFEFPAGGIKCSENPKTAAKRELYEETGIVIKNLNKLKKLSKLSINPQRNKKCPYCFYINISKNELFSKKINLKKNNEIYSVHIFTIKFLLRYIEKGLISSSFMIACFFQYILKKKLFKLKLK